MHAKQTQETDSARKIEQTQILSFGPDSGAQKWNSGPRKLGVVHRDHRAVGGTRMAAWLVSVGHASGHGWPTGDTRSRLIGAECGRVRRRAESP